MALPIILTSLIAILLRGKKRKGICLSWMNLNREQKENVKTIEKYFDRFGDNDRRKLAYIIATAWHESRLMPIEEVRARTGTGLRALQDRYWISGYYGRGFVQITWPENYRKVGNMIGQPLLSNPSLALDKDIAAMILVRGMMEGWFTGKKLSDYIRPGKADYFNSRRVVNLVDKANLIKLHTNKILCH